MTTEELKNKIKAHILEFPNDKSPDIAAVFNVPITLVYDMREILRRHRMIPRAHKKANSKKVHAVKTVQPAVEDKVVELVKDDVEIARLKAEIARLKVIVSYLESALKLSKAA